MEQSNSYNQDGTSLLAEEKAKEKSSRPTSLDEELLI